MPDHHTRVAAYGVMIERRRILLARFYDGVQKRWTLRDETGGSTDRARWFDLDEVPELPRVRLVDAGIGLWTRAQSTATDHAV